MYLSATNEVQVETAGSDVTYIFPVRPLGKVGWVGLILIVFGLLFLSFPTSNVSGFFKQIASGKNDLMDGFFLLFMIPFVLGGLVPLALGFLLMAGRCRVEWRDQRISVLDYCGPIRWRRRFPKEPVRKFVVQYGGAEINGRPVTTGPLATLGGIKVEFEQSKPRLLVLGYPRDWLQSLADDLAPRVGAASPVAAPKVEVVEFTGASPEMQDVEQPANSKVVIERGAHSLRMTIPPAGLGKGSKGMFFFGVIWCLFMCVFTAGILFSESKNSKSVPWPVWIFIVAFWGVGISLLAGGWNMGRRRATILVEQGRLVVEQMGLFGAKQWISGRGEIATIRADGSGMEVNDVPVIELQVHPIVGKKRGFFAGRDNDELRWMATELRRALAVPAKTSEKNSGVLKTL